MSVYRNNQVATLRIALQETWNLAEFSEFYRAISIIYLLIWMFDNEYGLKGSINLFIQSGYDSFGLNKILTKIRKEIPKSNPSMKYFHLSSPGVSDIEGYETIINILARIINALSHIGGKIGDKTQKEREHIKNDLKREIANYITKKLKTDDFQFERIFKLICIVLEIPFNVIEDAGHKGKLIESFIMSDNEWRK